MARHTLETDPAIQLRDDMVSISFLLFLIGILAVFQVVILISLPLLLPFVIGIVVAECLWSALFALVIRSMIAKLKERKDKKSANLFMSAIRQGEFDDKKWYELTSCPRCQTLLTERDFSSEQAGHVWKMKHCSKCDEIVAKRLILNREVNIDEEESDFSDIRFI
jgi:hypothetical protein